MEKRTDENESMKKPCSLPCDRISGLPSSISEIILMFLPLRDMARTSILSKQWRYQWVNVPQLVFKDDPKYLVSRERKYIYSALKVFGILLLHQGPISKFTLDLTSWIDRSEIDKIIIFLSRIGIKELKLLMLDEEESYSYKLPSSVLSCVELRHLSLSSCIFQSLTFVGLSKLVRLELLNVRLDSDLSISSCPLLQSLRLNILSDFGCFTVDAPNLKYLFFVGVVFPIGYINTPALQVLSLDVDNFTDRAGRTIDLIKFLQPLLLLRTLTLRCDLYVGPDTSDSSNGFPTVLNNLRVLKIFMDLAEVSTTLWLLRNSPNLQKLKIRLIEQAEFYDEWKGYLKMQERYCYSLLQLQEVEIVIVGVWSDLRLFIEFFVFLLEVSPELKTFSIRPSCKANVSKNELLSLVELACYPRASPKAKIVYVGLD